MRLLSPLGSMDWLMVCPFHSKTVFLVFKSDMIVVGMVFFGGGEEHAKKGVLAKK